MMLEAFKLNKTGDDTKKYNEITKVFKTIKFVKICWCRKPEAKKIKSIFRALEFLLLLFYFFGNNFRLFVQFDSRDKYKQMYRTNT